jgi:predicted phosphate transport protein (TIGR00153 family)
MDLLFRRTRELERQIDDYLDMVVEGGMLFKKGVRLYMEGRTDEFEECLATLDKSETDADHLRRDIETRLYTHTLIPESRGDVLGLLETIDDVLNRSEENLLEYSVEKPEFLPEISDLYLELTESTVACIEAMIMATRAYFRDPKSTRDHIAKARFHEKEADGIAEKIKRMVFATDIELSQKMHHRYFALHIDQIADAAEDVCDRLAIATIKRSL